MKAYIKWHGQDIEVTGTHYKSHPGDLETPPEPESFEISKIEKDGVDITDIIEMVPESVSEIEQLVLNDIHL